jgi:hypothetical protein
VVSCGFSNIGFCGIEEILNVTEKVPGVSIAYFALRIDEV